MNGLMMEYGLTLSADIAMWSAVVAVRVFGGRGYSEDYPVEGLLSDAKAVQIYEGTNEMQRTIMVRAPARGRVEQAEALGAGEELER